MITSSLLNRRVVRWVIAEYKESLWSPVHRFVMILRLTSMDLKLLPTSRHGRPSPILPFTLILITMERLITHLYFNISLIRRVIITSLYSFFPLTKIKIGCISFSFFLSVVFLLCKHSFCLIFSLQCWNKQYFIIFYYLFAWIFGFFCLDFFITSCYLFLRNFVSQISKDTFAMKKKDGDLLWFSEYMWRHFDKHIIYFDRCTAMIWG